MSKYNFVTNLILTLILINENGKFEIGATTEKIGQLCAPKGFYCRTSVTCVPRRWRCPSGNDRLWKQSLAFCSKQEHCQPVYSVATVAAITSRRRGQKAPSIFGPNGLPLGDRFFVLTAFSPIYRSGSRSGRRRRGLLQDAWKTLVNDPWMHSFVQYRGFVYEFGTYGVHELDINDPRYKYGYDGEWTTGWSRVGTSACKHRQLRRFMKMWRKKRNAYSWYSNNCHSFTKALLTYLRNDCKNVTFS